MFGKSQVLVPKKQSILSMNDLRPIAPTWCVMKGFEKFFPPK